MPERAIVFLALAQTLIWACTSYSFPALLLWWEEDLGWSRGVLTGAFTLALLVSACASPYAGRLIDRGQGPAMMGLGTICAGIFIGCLSMISELWQFYLLWILIGVAISGCLYEPCFALITRARGIKGRRGIVIITLFAGFASTLSFPTAHYLSSVYGWRIAVQVFCAVAVFIAAPLMFAGARSVEASYKPASEPQEEREIPQVRHSFLKRPEFWLLGLAFAFGALMQQITIHHLLAILEDRNVVRDIAVIAAAFIGPMQVAGRIAMILTERRTSTYAISIAVFIAMALSAVMLMLSGSGLVFVAGFAILFGAANGVVSIIRPVLAYEILGKEDFGAKSGMLASLFFVGGAVAPFTGSVIWKAGGYNIVLGFMMMLALIGLCLFVLAYRRRLATV